MAAESSRIIVKCNQQHIKEPSNSLPAVAVHSIFYDGLLQIGRLILLMNGYRPDDGEQHKTTFLVAGELLGEDYHNLIRRIQKFRIKRNDCIYDPKGLISKIETDAIFKVSKEFWGKVKIYLEEKNPQLKLFNVF